MRLFLALNFPEDVRHRLREAAAPLVRRGYPVRWLPAEQLHLTLKFLGDVDEARMPDLRAALTRAAAGTRPLTVAFHGLGAFPSAERPRILWAGIVAEPALELLQHQVEREFAPLGFPPEGRPFHPHVTIGRVEKDARPRDFKSLAGMLEDRPLADGVLVDSVDLMASALQPRGAVYEILDRERLS